MNDDMFNKGTLVTILLAAISIIGLVVATFSNTFIWKIIGVIAGIVGIVGDAIVVWRVAVWHEDE